MKTSVIYDKIDAVTKEVYSISDGIVKAEQDSYDYQYLAGKALQLENVVKHIKDQLKYKAKNG